MYIGAFLLSEYVHMYSKSTSPGWNDELMDDHVLPLFSPHRLIPVRRFYGYGLLELASLGAQHIEMDVTVSATAHVMRKKVYG